MTRVNLDNWQATVDQWRRSGADELEGGITVEGLGALVAELRAAREVVDVARAAQLNPLQGKVRGWVSLEHAVAAYDKAVG